MSVFLTSVVSRIGPSTVIPGVLAHWQILAFGANPSVAVLPIQRLFGRVRYGPKCVQDKRKACYIYYLVTLPEQLTGMLVSKLESFVILSLAKILSISSRTPFFEGKSMFEVTGFL